MNEIETYLSVLEICSNCGRIRHKFGHSQNAGDTQISPCPRGKHQWVSAESNSIAPRAKRARRRHLKLIFPMPHEPRS